MNEFDAKKRPVSAWILGGISVVVCYYFVDRPVARFIYEHRFYPYEFLLWPPRISECVGYLIVLGTIAVVAWWLWRPGGQLQTLLLAIGINAIATEGIKNVLKWGFGRTWPEPWFGSTGLALIPDGVYGFHPFQSGMAYQSFPSGHAAATFAIASILWLSRPRWRGLYAVAAGTICAALVGLNFHFVSDVIAGAMLGSATGVLVTWLLRLEAKTEA